MLYEFWLRNKTQSSVNWLTFCCTCLGRKKLYSWVKIWLAMIKLRLSSLEVHRTFFIWTCFIFISDVYGWLATVRRNIFPFELLLGLATKGTSQIYHKNWSHLSKKPTVISCFSDKGVKSHWPSDSQILRNYWEM